MKASSIFAFAVAITFSGGADAFLFEDDCSSLKQWDVLDLGAKAGEVYAAKDASCPSPHGPSIIHVKGESLLLMPKGQRLKKGTLVVLYRENDAERADSDGVLMVWADYPDDIERAHNLKESRPRVWVNQDSTTGLRLWHTDTDGKDSGLGEAADEGALRDAWNASGWVWQKVHVDGDRIRAKFWAAHEPEPTKWTLDAKPDCAKGSRFGIRVGSGDVDVAYFAADPNDIPIEPPAAFLHFPLKRAVQTRRLPLTLFTNAKTAGDETFRITVTAGAEQLAQEEFGARISKGGGALPILLCGPGESAESKGVLVKLEKEPGKGTCMVTVRSKTGTYKAETAFDIAPMREFQTQLDELDAIVEQLSDALSAVAVTDDTTGALFVIRDAAAAHAARARSLFQNAQVDDAEFTLRFAYETLAELNGYKGEWLREVAPSLVLPRIPYDPKDRRRFQEPKDKKRSTYYSMDSSIRFGEATLSSQSFSMGHTYTVSIPWSVQGKRPDCDFTFSYALKSPMETRTVACCGVSRGVRTSKWKPGKTYVHEIELEILPEDPMGKKGFLDQPAVLDEYHRLLVSVIEPDSGAHVLLGNEPGFQNSRMGVDFCVADVYVGLAEVEVRDFAPTGGVVLAARTDTATIANTGKTVAKGLAVLTARSDTDRILYQDTRPIEIPPGTSIPLSYDWTPDTAGLVELHLRVMRDGISITEAKREIDVAPPKGCAVEVHKANHVESVGNTFVTPISIAATQTPVAVQVFAKGRLVGQGSADEGKVLVKAEPWFGYYDVQVRAGEVRWDERIVATVVETAGPDLLVNGEPFLVKGTNVHGLNSQSPAYTATMMRTMRDLGFNMWRADYPARWQVDLAYELGTAYTVLAPFSCDTTAEVFGRQAGPPMATARELSRIFAQRYRDSAGVLMWNSCNEIRGETPDFLEAMYPVYQNLDPYNRPVHYANLFGQSCYEGQDIMGVNCYFWKGRPATSRQEDLLQLIDVAQANDIPVFFNEFNSWYGAVQSSGVEALHDLYMWGVEQGMAGGFQYKAGDSDRHPGAYDRNCNTHKIHDAAFIDAFADARVLAEHTSREQLTIQVVNRRRFHLRGMTLSLFVSGVPSETIVLDDLAPGKTHEASVTIPAGAVGPAFSLTGRLEFTTHFGFRCKVPVDLIVPAP